MGLNEDDLKYDITRTIIVVVIVAIILIITPIITDIEKLRTKLLGNKYKSINPQTPLQKLTTASAINNVREALLKCTIFTS